MFKRLLTGKLVILPVLFVAILFIAGQADAQTKVSGKLTLAYSNMDTLVVGDAEGHNIAMAESKGTNASAGETTFMDGAEVTNISFADLTMGSGPHEGYVTFSHLFDPNNKRIAENRSEHQRR